MAAIVSTDEDGDTVSNAERKAVAEADEWHTHNQPIPHEEVLAEFGLTLDDFERMGHTPLAPEENGADR